MNPFETETMADLCLRQGHRDEALAIYRRLLASTLDQAARARMSHRIVAVENGAVSSGPVNATPGPASGPHPPVHDEPQGPLRAPGVRARRSGDQLTVEWRLPVEIQRPSLEVLLVKHGPGGVVTETRAIDVDGNAGEVTIGARGLHSARIAVGRRGPWGFIPLKVAGFQAK